MWLSLGYHVVAFAVLLWLTALCVKRRSRLGLAVTVIFLAVNAVLLGLLVWALRRRYGGIGQALRRDPAQSAADDTSTE